ncbi:hypothetical protein DOY81_010579 [Sarcophaga bullata]|nr:hypothetical protein DOY81_010579 [Sarcophaga bullata]
MIIAARAPVKDIKKFCDSVREWEEGGVLLTQKTKQKINFVTTITLTSGGAALELQLVLVEARSSSSSRGS